MQFSEAPGFAQFPLVRRCPFHDQPERTRRKVTFQDRQLIDGNDRFLPGIAYVKMRRRMVVVEHHDDDAEEA
jgi:hypothetical protein